MRGKTPAARGTCDVRKRRVALGLTFGPEKFTRNRSDQSYITHQARACFGVLALIA